MKKVVLVDDERVILDMVCWILKEMQNEEVVGMFSSAEELIAKIDLINPDVVIMDLGLPGIGGIEAIAILKSHYPSTQFLVLSNYSDDERLFNALKAGADGYLLKSDNIENIGKALKEVFDGGSPISPIIAKKLIGYFNKNDDTVKFKELSEKEYKVLQLLVDGLLYKEIAAKLGVTIDAIKKHAQSIYEKLHVRTRSEAITMYLKKP